MEGNVRLAKLISEGLASVSACQTWTRSKTDEALAAATGRSIYSIRNWRRGQQPQDPECIEAIIHFCSAKGRVDRQWAQALLAETHYQHRDQILREAFPGAVSPIEIAHDYQNLVPRFGEFIERPADMKRVFEGLSSRYPVVAIEGLAGVGKTTLALEVAYRCLPQSESGGDLAFDAVLWISARDRPEEHVWLEYVIDTCARVLDFFYITQLSLESKQHEMETLLRQYRCLLVIDNFETIEDPALERWLLHVPEPSKVLLTTRTAQLRSVWPIHLRGMKHDLAVKFLARHSHRLDLTLDEESMTHLADVTEGNPIAMLLALDHVQAGLSVAEIVDHLHNARETVNDIFQYLIEGTWAALSGECRLVLLSVPFFAAAATKNSLAKVSGLASYSMDQACKQLIHRSLFELADEPGKKRLRFLVHPLVRAYATAQLKQDPAWEIVARERWAAYYEVYAQEHGQHDRDDPTHFLLLEEEWQNLLLVAHWLYEHQQEGRLFAFVRNLEQFTHVFGYWVERVTLIRLALELCQARGQEERSCMLLCSLAYTIALRDEFDEAQSVLATAVGVAQKLDDPVLLDQAYFMFTLVGQRSKDSDLITQYLPRWEKLIRDHGSERFPSRRPIDILYRKGTVAYGQRDFSLATTYFEPMLRLSRELNWDRSVATALLYLGRLATRREDYEAADNFLNEGWQLIQRWQDKRHIANYGKAFSLLEEHRGNLLLAYAHAQRALDLFHRLGMRREEVETVSIMARQRLAGAGSNSGPVQ